MLSTLNEQSDLLKISENMNDKSKCLYCLNQHLWQCAQFLFDLQSSHTNEGVWQKPGRVKDWVAVDQKSIEIAKQIQGPRLTRQVPLNEKVTVVALCHCHGPHETLHGHVKNSLEERHVPWVLGRIEGDDGGR